VAHVPRVYDLVGCRKGGLPDRPEGIPLAREQRKLAAIMAADVVGYARLMGRDEAGTLLRLKKWRGDCLEPSLAKNGGPATASWLSSGVQSTPCARRTKARSALADFLRLVPDATVASTRAQVPLKGAGDLDRYVAALRRAGLRDS